VGIGSVAGRPDRIETGDPSGFLHDSAPIRRRLQEVARGEHGIQAGVGILDATEPPEAA